MFEVLFPNPHWGEGEWVSMGYFDTREEAIIWLKENWGADDMGLIDPICESPIEDEE